jgi:hypothetical protein
MSYRIPLYSIANSSHPRREHGLPKVQLICRGNVASDAMGASDRDFEIAQPYQCLCIGLNRSDHLLRGGWTSVAESTHCTFAPRLNDEVRGSNYDASHERGHAGKQHDIDKQSDHVRSPRAQPSTHPRL